MAYGTTKVDVIQSSTAGLAPQFNDGNGAQTGTLCRAWVNFNGTGTVAIRSSFNVSSITDNGVGDYTINFTNAMPDTNYSAVFGASGVISASTYAIAAGAVTYNTSSVRVRTTMSTTYYDSDVSASIFR